MSNGADSGIQAARHFYQLLQLNNPSVKARWNEILILAQRGDAEAIRAVRLIQYVQNTPSSGINYSVGATMPAHSPVTPEVIVYLRRIIIAARNKLPPAISPIPIPPRPVAV